MTPYYQQDGITIYHGDCQDILPSLSSIDLIVTSPPYNLGDMSGGLANLAGGYLSYGDQRDDYDEWQRAVLSACWLTLSDDGAIFYNHKPVVREGLVSLPTRLNPGLPLRQIIVWYREMGVNWSPTHFLPVHEWILVFAKPSWRLIDKSASHRSDVWRLRPDMKANEHPAPFPLSVPLAAIGATSASVVLDPFMGSGTTLRAAKNLGRRAIGIEIEERYCELAASRLAQQVLAFG